MNRFTFTSMNDSQDRQLTAYLTQAMDSGIKKVGYSDENYNILIKFNDGSKLTAWNKNKYYAWLSGGTFLFPGKHSGGFEWNDARPSKSAMARLYKMLKRVVY